MSKVEDRLFEIIKSEEPKKRKWADPMGQRQVDQYVHTKKNTLCYFHTHNTSNQMCEYFSHTEHSLTARCPTFHLDSDIYQS